MPPIETEFIDEPIEVTTIVTLEKKPIESNPPTTPTTPTSTKECDFDKDPTQLYLATQAKDWALALAKSQESPHEARIWVSRKESNGKLRWRLLPLHAAIIFKAPESVVEAFLSAYPKGAECKDDQGMLPLHLAFRNGSTEGIVNLLLVAYPQSIDIQDRKGRIPLFLAQASTSPNRDAFMRALERGPTYYAVAAAATERAAVTAELRAIFDAKLIEIKSVHTEEMTGIVQEAKETKEKLELRLEELEVELKKTHETSQVLVDHVNSLDAQLSSRSDTERFLATKIATLDSSLKEVTVKKDESESVLLTENQQIKAENEDNKLKISELEARCAELSIKLAEVEPAYLELQLTKEKMNKKHTEAYEKLEFDCAVSQANAAVLEAQLKKKIEIEHSLASQVSLLAARLAESASESASFRSTQTRNIRKLEVERDSLYGAVEDLTKRLQNVAKALDTMSEEQEVIVHATAMHEATMAAAATEHAKILSDAKRHDDLLRKADQEREEIKKTLIRQEEEVLRSTAEREVIANAMKAQEEHFSISMIQRNAIVTNVTKQRQSIRCLIEGELGVIPHVLSEDENLVDVITKNLLKAKVNCESAQAVEMTLDDAQSTMASQPSAHEEAVSEPVPQEISKPVEVEPRRPLDTIEAARMD